MVPCPQPPVAFLFLLLLFLAVKAKMWLVKGMRHGGALSRREVSERQGAVCGSWPPLAICPITPQHLVSPSFSLLLMLSEVPLRAHLSFGLWDFPCFALSVCSAPPAAFSSPLAWALDSLLSTLSGSPFTLLTMGPPWGIFLQT